MASPSPLLRVLAVVVTASALAGPAAAAPGRDAAGADDLDVRWQAAAAGVEQAEAEYERSEAGLAVALQALGRAFATATGADRDAEAAQARWQADRAARGRLVRSLYASGGTALLTATVISAPDAEAALWRASSDRRLIGVVLAADADGVDRSAAVAAQRRRAQAQAQAAADDAAAQLSRARSSGDAAQASLERARGLLAQLTESKRLRAEQLEQARVLAAQLAATQARAEAARRAAVTSVAAAGIPPAYALDYRAAAATCPGMDWTLLAAVGQIESGHGRNNGPSSAGAIGPMQFMPRTFASYAVDGDGDGTTDAWNPTDAIYTAAHYLCATGGGQGPDGEHRALLAYNHAEWYVQLVLAARSSIAAAAS